MNTVRLSNGKTFETRDGLSLLENAEAAGLVLEHSCRTGRCSSCRARVVSGDTEAMRAEEGLLRDGSDAGWILTCVRAARSDVTLDVADIPGKRHPRRIVPSRIQSLQRVAPGVVRVILRLPPSAAFRYRAGQYVDVISPAGLRRSYSVANAPGDGATRIELHVRQVPGGAMSGYWFDTAKTDDLLRLDGPLGTFYLHDVAGDDVTFLATGTGIAPVKAMLEDLATLDEPQRPRSITVYWGARVASDHYWQPPRDFDGLSLRFVTVLSRAAEDWPGARGWVQDVFLAEAPDLSRQWIYACGSNAMIESAQSMLRERGLAQHRFHSDAFVASN